MSDSALLRSGTILPGQKGLEFNSVISPAWGDYELTLRGIFPAPFQNQPGYVLLFMHLSNDNGAPGTPAAATTSMNSSFKGAKEPTIRSVILSRFPVARPFTRGTLDKVPSMRNSRSPSRAPTRRVSPAQFGSTTLWRTGYTNSSAGTHPILALTTSAARAERAFIMAPT
jgi:hypothetical protein